MENGNLKLALQKKGRLSDRSIELLKHCGLDIETYSERLMVTVRNYNVDLLFLRDDDIPEYVQDGVADIGIVGEDVVYEKQSDIIVSEKLGFGRCRLMIAAPNDNVPEEPSDLKGKTIATSYPNILKKYLAENKIDSKVIEISGSVEIAPSLGVADLICDIVSTGTTLMMNKLKKSFTVFESEAVLISNKWLQEDKEKYAVLNDLLLRIRSVLSAKNSKYLMMNVPKKNLDKVIGLIPSLKSPTILHLADEESLAVHAVIPSEQFWKIIGDLKAAGASGILLFPIENMII
ncbi:MAG: ATP phosphoribosyltransferase [Ignavibacteriales bacterium]|nr:MAG: ATP phosphoribosyltransferase [Ignavibacteriales bacterium]